jgi:hypothetical protein
MRSPLLRARQKLVRAALLFKNLPAEGAPSYAAASSLTSH